MADPTAELMSDERRLSQLKLPLITFHELGKKLFNDWSELAAELGIDADEVRHKAITQTDGALARELVSRHHSWASWVLGSELILGV